MITKNDFVEITLEGQIIISIRKLKEAMIKSGKILSDRKNLYFHKQNLFYENLKDNEDDLRYLLMTLEAQSEVGKYKFDKLINDLLVDARILCRKTNMNNPQYINFNNGLYDLYNKKFIDFLDPTVSDLKFDYHLDADYLEPAHYTQQIPVFNKFVTETFNCEFKDETFQYFLENIGYLLSSVNNLRKAVVFMGAPASGKSTIAKFLAACILPKNMVSHVNFQDLGDRFRLYNAVNAKLNIGDEMNRVKMRNLANFKSITSGDCILIERKGHDPLCIEPNVRQLYCTNHLPSFDDGDASAIFDRLNIILFKNTVKENIRELDLLEKFLKEKDAILSFAVRAFSDVISRNGCFSVPREFIALKERYATQENSVKLFLELKLQYDEKAKGLGSVEIYDMYKSFCYENNLNLKGKTELREEICNTFNNVEYKKIRLNKSRNIMSYSKLTWRDVEPDDEK